jgi:hypothetical protein
MSLNAKPSDFSGQPTQQTVQPTQQSEVVPQQQEEAPSASEISSTSDNQLSPTKSSQRQPEPQAAATPHLNHLTLGRAKARRTQTSSRAALKSRLEASKKSHNASSARFHSWLQRKTDAQQPDDAIKPVEAAEPSQQPQTVPPVTPVEIPPADKSITAMESPQQSQAASSVTSAEISPAEAEVRANFKFYPDADSYYQAINELSKQNSSIDVRNNEIDRIEDALKKLGYDEKDPNKPDEASLIGRILAQKNLLDNVIQRIKDEIKKEKLEAKKKEEDAEQARKVQRKLDTEQRREQKKAAKKTTEENEASSPLLKIQERIKHVKEKGKQKAKTKDESDETLAAPIPKVNPRSNAVGQLTQKFQSGKNAGPSDKHAKIPEPGNLAANRFASTTATIARTAESTPRPQVVNKVSGSKVTKVPTQANATEPKPVTTSAITPPETPSIPVNKNTGALPEKPETTTALDLVSIKSDTAVSQTAAAPEQKLGPSHLDKDDSSAKTKVTSDVVNLVANSVNSSTLPVTDSSIQTPNLITPVATNVKAEPEKAAEPKPVTTGSITPPPETSSIKPVDINVVGVLPQQELSPDANKTASETNPKNTGTPPVADSSTLPQNLVTPVATNVKPEPEKAAEPKPVTTDVTTPSTAPQPLVMSTGSLAAVAQGQGQIQQIGEEPNDKVDDYNNSGCCWCNLFRRPADNSEKKHLLTPQLLQAKLQYN